MNIFIISIIVILYSLEFISHGVPYKK